MDLAAAFHRGLSLHHTGCLAEAREIYQQILRIDSANFDCLHFLGIIELQLSNYPEAERLLGAALAANASVAEVFNNHGVALEALKRHQEAIGSFDRAIALNPDYVDALINRGRALTALDRYAEAIASFDHAIAINGNSAGAYNYRGRVLGALKQYGHAVRDFDQAIALDPDNAEAHGNRGIALGALERYDAAVESFDRALALNPDDANTHRSRGTILKALARNAEAAASFERALALDPRSAQTHLDYGIALYSLGRHELALASFDRAIALQAGYAEGADARAIALSGLNRLEEAIESYDKALIHEPDFELIPGKRLHTIMQICRWEGIDEAFASLLRQIDQGHRAALPFQLLAMPSSPAQQKRAAELFCKGVLSSDSSRHWTVCKRQRQKLRIGYFSADFYNHATAQLAAGLFEMHDRKEFEVIGFSLSDTPTDAMRRRLNTAFDRMIDVNSTADNQIAAIARDMQIDIAVDLKGHTLHGRPGIFMHRAAPIQVSYLGYPGTMGMKSIDYLIADPVLIPPEHRQYYHEKIAYLPPSYQVNDFKRPISDRVFTRRELDLPGAGFVFCCFNNSYKITPAVFDVWMRLLHKIGDSVLWLLDTNAAAIRNLRAEAQKRGISPDRLIFAERMDSPSHLARHRVADLFLDTFFCSAHTTASDALWAGLPVLTKLGDTFAGRVPASLLTAIGLPDLIVQTTAEYEERAVALATQPNMLADLKSRLEENKWSHSLFDTIRFAENIEAVYRRMWEIYERGGKPEHFDVADLSAQSRE